MTIVMTGMALVGGAACKGEPFDPTFYDTYSVVAWGANVVPAPPPGDSSARAMATINIATLAYTYSVAVPPPGTIDSIALYQIAAGAPLPMSATAMLCAGAAACAPTSGTATVLAPATIASIRSSMRVYGTQMVFFTTAAQKTAGGAMRGTMYLSP